MSGQGKNGEVPGQNLGKIHRPIDCLLTYKAIKVGHPEGEQGESQA